MRTVNLDTELGRLRIWIMNHPDWHDSAHIADDLGFDRHKTSVYLARLARKGLLERRPAAEARKGLPGPGTEYRLPPGTNLLAPPPKEK